MTLNTCASMKLEVHFQRKQVCPARPWAGEGLGNCAVVAAIGVQGQHPCAWAAPGSQQLPALPGCLFPCHPGLAWPWRCLADSVGACVYPVPPHSPEALAAAVGPQELSLCRPGCGGCAGLGPCSHSFTSGVSAELRSKTPQQHVLQQLILAC